MFKRIQLTSQKKLSSLRRHLNHSQLRDHQFDSVMAMYLRHHQWFTTKKTSQMNYRNELSEGLGRRDEFCPCAT